MTLLHSKSSSAENREENGCANVKNSQFLLQIFVFVNKTYMDECFDVIKQ